MKYSLYLLPVIFMITVSCDTENKPASSAAADYTNIVINEIQSSATAGYISEDFVELYNTSDCSYTFNTDEWYLTDSDGDPVHILYIPGGTEIKGHGYLVILTDVTDMTNITDAPEGSIYSVADGVNIRFSLVKSCSISLFYTGSGNPSPNVAADSSIWTEHVSSRARIPDGGEWDPNDMHTPTPGASNILK